MNTMPSATGSEGEFTGLFVPVDPRVETRLVTVPATGLAAYQQLVGGPVVVHYPSTSWRLYSLDAEHGAAANIRGIRLAQWADPGWSATPHGPVVVVGAGPTSGVDIAVPPEVVRFLRGES